MNLGWENTDLASRNLWVQPTALYISGIVLYAHNPNTKKIDVQDHPWLPSKFENTRGYIKLCIKKIRETQQITYLLNILTSIQ